MKRNTRRLSLATRLAVIALGFAFSLFVARPCSADPSTVFLRGITGAPALTTANLPSAVTLAGNTYTHAVAGPAGATGTGADAIWRVDFALGGKYGKFSALAGVADQLDRTSGAIFIVEGDGKQIAGSAAAQYSGDPPLRVDVDVSGINTLSLIVKTDGKNPLPAQVLWADPALYPAPRTAIPAPARMQVPGTLVVVPYATACPDISPPQLLDISTMLTQMTDDQVGADSVIKVTQLSDVQSEVKDTRGYLDTSGVVKVGHDFDATYVICGRAVIKIRKGFPVTTIAIDIDGSLQDASTGRVLKRTTVEGKADLHVLGGSGEKTFKQAAKLAVDQFAAAMEEGVKNAGGSAAK